tara:strand:+ start:46186 stop:46680 length:495 start_codon:yes stop_codon:yes gene_type:complete
MNSRDTAQAANALQRSGSRWMSLGLLLLSLFLLWSSRGIGDSAARIPQAVLILTLLFLALQIVFDLRRPANAGAAEGKATRSDARAIWSALFWLALMFLALWLLGVSGGVTLFCAAYLRWYAGESWLLSSVFAVSLGVSVQLVFAFALQAALYPGVLRALPGGF